MRACDQMAYCRLSFSVVTLLLQHAVVVVVDVVGDDEDCDSDVFRSTRVGKKSALQIGTNGI